MADDRRDVDQLTLAYAISAHKSQGSEFPTTVMPVVTQYYTMLQRNLLHAAITHARNLCELAGNQRAIEIAVRNNKATQRFTALEWCLVRFGHLDVSILNPTERAFFHNIDIASELLYNVKCSTI